MSRNRVCATVAVVGIALALVQQSASAAFVTIYGGPTYNSVTGTGYQYPVLSTLGAGTAVSTAYSEKYVANFSKGNRAFRLTPSSLVELDDLGTDITATTNTYGIAINDGGTVAGFAVKYVSGSNYGTRAVRWASGGTSITVLDDLGTDGTTTDALANAINNAGTVVGFAVKYAAGVNLGTRPVRWLGGGTAATELGILQTDNGYGSGIAYGVNESGAAVGYSDIYSLGGDYLGRRALRWSSASTVPEELGNLGTDAGTTNGEASAINASGVAIGRYEKYVSGTSKGHRAVRWNAGSATPFELDVLGEDAFETTESYPQDINDGGLIVGRVEKYVATVDKGQRAVRWAAGGTAVTELGILTTDPDGYTSSNAWAVNNRGLTVGQISKFDGFGDYQTDVAVLWGPNTTTPIDLNTLIDPASGWQLQYATAISNSSWITGGGLYDPDGAGGQDAYARMFLLQFPIAGDLDDDGDVDGADIDTLWHIVRGTAPDPHGDDSGDLNCDSLVNEDDVDNLLAAKLDAGTGRHYGDADVDGDVDGADFDAWRLRTGYTGAGTGHWSIGDFDGDGDVDGADFDLWRLRPTAYPSNVGAHGSELAAVPEPGAMVLAGIGAAMLLVVRRQTAEGRSVKIGICG